MEIKSSIVPLSEFLSEAKGMKVINHITTFSKLNQKAAELCEWCEGYDKVLFAEPKDWERFSNKIHSKVKELNEKYPRARAFEVYSETSEYLHVCVKDRPDESVVRISITPVKRAYQQDE